MQLLSDGSVTNFIITAPLTGYVPMKNNGGTEPNVNAETLHNGEIDGRLSDGTLINENVDAGFVLDFEEPESKERVKLFVTSVSEEQVVVDAAGDLIFSLTAGFDPGLPEFVVTMKVVFVTGLTRLPLSTKTQNGQTGGIDGAGRFDSGYLEVGKLGDFNNDGFLDGVFILSGNAPENLVLAEGNPILVIRPFRSNIPVSGTMAALYTLRGVTNHYPKILRSVSDLQEWQHYVDEIAIRIKSIEGNLDRANRRRRSIRAGSTENTYLSQAISSDLHDFVEELSELEIQDRNRLEQLFNSIEDLEDKISGLEQN